ncbi:MAG: Holliday junction branch migration protein RuvA [Saprospiraceae bacterium]|nr:Holliday junction branch migration protein RuvA [Saprospiraceae bacterium]
MIDFIKGQIAYKNPAFIILETSGGVGYRLNISLNTYSKIEKEENVRLLTHLQIREDAHVLFGFAEESERHLFQMLISVSGVGPATAQVLLSGMNADEVRSAIIGENEAAFNKVKGIGPKTAKRIILDLKDKVVKDGGVEAASLNLSVGNNTMRDEAMSALIALGFQRIAVQKVLNKILLDKAAASVEDLIKTAIRQLT